MGRLPRLPSSLHPQAFPRPRRLSTASSAQQRLLRLSVPSMPAAPAQLPASVPLTGTTRTASHLSFVPYLSLLHTWAAHCFLNTPLPLKPSKEPHLSESGGNLNFSSRHRRPFPTLPHQAPSPPLPISLPTSRPVSLQPPRTTYLSPKGLHSRACLVLTPRSRWSCHSVSAHSLGPIPPVPQDTVPASSPRVSLPIPQALEVPAENSHAGGSGPQSGRIPKCPFLGDPTEREKR